jgi:hypothetical protein
MQNAIPKRLIYPRRASKPTLSRRHNSDARKIIPLTSSRTLAKTNPYFVEEFRAREDDKGLQS